MFCYVCSFSAGCSWILYYMFSRHHHLADNVEFLTDCAERQDWIILLVFAELFQCPPSKVHLLLLSVLSCVTGCFSRPG